jgi:hypothetical protein
MKLDKIKGEDTRKGPPLWSSGQSSWLHNGDVLRFLWGTNWIYICYVEESRPLLWSSGQSSCLQLQRSGFDSRRYQIFWEVVGLERGPFSLVSTIEELLGRKSSGFGLEIREYGSRDPSRWSRGTLYPQKLALTPPTSGDRSVGIVRSRTKSMEFSSFRYTERIKYIFNTYKKLGFGSREGQKSSFLRRVQAGSCVLPSSYTFVTGFSILGLKWKGREADHLLPSISKAM